jgi:hypothetical protein
MPGIPDVPTIHQRVTNTSNTDLGDSASFMIWKPRHEPHLGQCDTSRPGMRPCVAFLFLVQLWPFSAHVPWSGAYLRGKCKKNHLSVYLSLPQ